MLVEWISGLHHRAHYGVVGTPIVTLRVLPASRGVADPRAETTPSPAKRSYLGRMVVHGE